MTGDWQSALDRARAEAPFLARGLDVLPDLEALLASGDGEAAMRYARAIGTDDNDVRVALRKERMALAVTLAIGDLAGAFLLDRVVGELTNFADRSLDAAISDAIRHRAGDVEPAGFTALALGKQGAGELNYSSDIDPILLFDPETLPRRERDEPGEAAQRVARRLVETLSQMTADGYVFRVDLRLRPASEVSPLAISFDAALSHYESSALAWERAAFIRARACAGDIAAGEDFLHAIRPFVWRRSLDFNAIDDIRRLTARIRDAHSGPTEVGPGFDLKKGRGGIREVEFFAQTHQLIHGGRKEALRVRGTREALDALAAENLISADTARELGEAYDQLRVFEHRLQMVSDQQTHSLPTDTVAIDGVARLHGFADGVELVEQITAICNRVAHHFDGLLEEPDRAHAVGDSGTRPVSEQLTALGYPDADKLTKRIERWSSGNIRALRSNAAQSAFSALLPALLETLAKAPNPMRAFTRFEDLLVSLPSAVNLFRLLEARPGLLDRLVRILTLAPPLADELARRPELLDHLIDQSANDLPADVAALAARMQHTEAGDDFEKRLDRIRRIVGELRFTLGTQLLEGSNDPTDIARGLARVAEAALQASAEAATQEFDTQHGTVEGGDMLIMGLGRLGGGVLSHASDLDIVYLFDAPLDAESDGERPLSATMYYNRLAQRVSAALSVPTAEGALYEVDTRLRPQGNQGPIAVGLEAFAKYQRQSAWTWEHMALTRARPVFGKQSSRGKVQAIIDQVLTADRDAEKLRTDVLKMRSDMAAHKYPKGPLDAKLLRGGLVDCEFLVHHAQLQHCTGFHPDLHHAIASLTKLGLLPETIAPAHAFMTRMLVATRLLAPDGDIPPPTAQSALAKACQCDDFAALLELFTESRSAIASAWAERFEETLEIEE